MLSSAVYLPDDVTQVTQSPTHTLFVPSRRRLNGTAPACLPPKSRGISAVQHIILSPSPCPDQQGSQRPTSGSSQVERKGHFGWRRTTQRAEPGAAAPPCPQLEAAMLLGRVLGKN